MVLLPYLQTVVATNSEAAGAKVKDVLESMGVQVRVVKNLRYARTMEKWQSGCFDEWQWPTAVMTIMWIFLFIYSFVRYNQYGTVPWENVVMFVSGQDVKSK